MLLPAPMAREKVDAVAPLAPTPLICTRFHCGPIVTFTRAASRSIPTLPATALHTYALKQIVYAPGTPSDCESICSAPLAFCRFHARVVPTGSLNPPVAVSSPNSQPGCEKSSLQPSRFANGSTNPNEPASPPDVANRLVRFATSASVSS